MLLDLDEHMIGPNDDHYILEGMRQKQIFDLIYHLSRDEYQPEKVKK